VAGPFATEPLVVYCEPWHGHTNRLDEDENVVTSHCSCVQTAVSALNDCWPVRATRNLPIVLCTNAALPADASGDAASIVTETVLPETDPLIIESVVALLPPPPGLVGLFPPPQPSMSDAMVTNEIA
jgi:hypothetical protein